MLVFLEQRNADVILDRHDRIVEVAVFPGIRRTFLAFDRIGIDIVAAETGARCNQVSTYALRREVDFARDRRIGVHGTGIRSHRYA